MDGCKVFWVGGWVGQLIKSCQITKNLIKRDLIKIIHYYLKIYDLWTHCPPNVVSWVEGWVHVKLVKIE